MRYPSSGGPKDSESDEDEEMVAKEGESVCPDGDIVVVFVVE